MASIFQNLIDSGTFPVTKVGRAVSRAYQQIAQDEAFQAVNLTAANTAADEITVAAQHGAGTNGGNYTITVSIPTWGTTYTTANVAWDAADTVIEAALDTASPSTVTNGDINVVDTAAAGLGDGNATFTCSGTVASIPVLITATDVDLSGGAGPAVGAVTRDTPGRKNRYGNQALTELLIVTGATHNAGEEPTLVDNTSEAVGWTDRPSLRVIKWLGAVAVSDEGTVYVKDQLETLFPGIVDIS